MNLLIVGSVATDTVDTPHGKVESALGGSAVYASIAASYFASPGIVGVVGADFGKKNINLLKKQNIDLTGLQIDPKGKTFHWSGYYEGDMNQAHTRETHLNVFESFNPIIPKVYRSARVVMLGNIHPALQLEVLRQVESPKLVLCDTMNYWITSEPKLLEQVFRKVNVVCVNDKESMQFTGKTSLPTAAKEILKLGPSRVIIKNGALGAHMFGKDTFFALPAVPLLALKDPTGAGDSLAGGFTGFMTSARTHNETAFRKALVVGTVMASYCVEDFSCRRTCRLTPKDITSRANLLREFSKVPSLRL